jgi:exportin-T
MIPLLSRIFESLNKPVEGTDDVIEQTSMRKAYLSFILNLLNNGMEAIFVSEGKTPVRIRLIEANRSKFDAILNSIVHYATDTSDATVEKIAFAVLNKMALVWSTHGTERQTRSEAALDRTFQDIFGRFVIEHLSRVCFEVPSKPSFNSNDAQSRLVCSTSDVV